MKSLYVKKSVFTFFLAFTAFLFIQAQSSSVHFDLDACNAILNTGDHMDYSEFTPQIDNSTCADLEVLGGYLYRNNPAVNKHSCTPGMNGAPAMCIGSHPACTFTPEADEALRIDLMLSPDINGRATLSELSFYEKAPTQYFWIGGSSGPNDYPTLFGVRILKNGEEVFLSTSIATELNWNLNTFNFSGSEFTVSEPTIFNIELLPYCPIGNGAPVSAWDIDEITIVANCCEAPDGGTLTGGPFDFCVGDSIPDYVSGVVLSGNSGPNSQWVITNDSNMILSLPVSLDSVNFDSGGQGVCLIWNISYFDTLEGLIPGNNLHTDVIGCFDLSNALTVIRNQPEGGTLTGGPFDFCVGDSIPDYVSGVVLSGNSGPNSQWVITNDSNMILSLPVSLDSVNFDGGGQGVCLIWNISYFDTLEGLIPGNNLLTDVIGCFDLSNALTVIRNQPEGGTLTGGPFDFCVGDSIPDYVSGVVLSGNVGSSSQWVITDDANMILGLPASLDSVNFDDAGQGICLIWNISYDGMISGLVPGNNLLTDVTGCFDLSNSITVVRNQPEGGTLTGGPFEFCAGDSITDVTSILLTGNVGPNSQWVVTNDINIIMSLSGTLEEIDFGGNAPGVFLIWNISYFGTLSGLVVGNNLFEEVTGCSGISDSVIVVLIQPDGGTLTGGPFEFCVGDSIADHVSGIVLSGETGENSQWVITDDANNILGLPASPDSVNFDGGGAGICLIWHVSYDNVISGLEVGNNLFTDIVGCFGISNPLTVIRNQPEGGALTGGPFEFCVGDSIPDHVSGVALIGEVGANSQYVITDSLYNILNLPTTPEEVDFDEAPLGTCLIVHVSYDGPLTGLEIGSNLLTDLEGCFSLSNALTVIRLDCEGFQGGPIFEMKISPNPVRDVMTLQLFYKGDDTPVVQVFDAGGRLCLLQQHNSHSDMLIDMNNFAEGCYFIRVQSALGSKTTTVIVVK